MTSAAKKLVRMLDELGRISDERGHLTRTFLSPAMRQANARVADWMRAAGLAVAEDSVGNLIGRLDGATTNRLSSRPKTLLLGSHLDTVRNAGRFDGALGVLAPIVALAELRRRGIELPYSIEVIAFSEEEGVRFSSAYIGSKGYCGALRRSDLKLRDRDGVSLGDALAVHNGGHFELPLSAHRSRDLLGYVELHIEQGPVLEAKKLPVGVVRAIAGQTRGRLVFTGQASHAGTTPMPLRRDALAGAAEFTLYIEDLAATHAPLVATVGTLAIANAAPNVVPGEVTLSLDLRHPDDQARTRALAGALRTAKAIARRRKLACRWESTQDNAAVACSAELTQFLGQSVRAVQGRSVELVSGAGHDAVAMSRLTPVAMAFVRCRDGLSHHPDEYAAPADLEVAVDVLIDFLERLAKGQTAR